MDSKTKAILAASVVGLLMAKATGASAADPAATGKACETEACYGINACKGMGKCGGPGHSCAGKNACKGQGEIEVLKGTCKLIQGGSITPSSTTTKTPG